MGSQIVLPHCKRQVRRCCRFILSFHLFTSITIRTLSHRLSVLFRRRLLAYHSFQVFQVASLTYSMRVLDILLWFPIWAVCSPITVWKDFNPTFFDKGLYGAYLGHNYVSFDLVPPKVAFVKYDSECSKDYTLISPRGRAVPTPGPMILDANGDLVWMEDRFGQAMDFRVQRYAGEDYLTFWVGSDSGTFGTGEYYMASIRYAYW